MSEPNYGAKQPNNTAYIKTFNIGTLDDLWSPTLFLFNELKLNVLTPTVQRDIYIPGDIYIGGHNIYTPSLKSNLNQKQNNSNNLNNSNNYSLEAQPQTDIFTKIQELQNQIVNIQKEIDELKNAYL